MKRIIQIGVVGLAVWLASTSTRGQSQEPTLSTPPPGEFAALSTDIALLRQAESYVVAGSRSGALHRTQVVIDPLVPTHTTERYDQSYQGVPIYGASLVLDSERGLPVSAFGTMVPDLTLRVDPTLTSSQATAALVRQGGAEAVLWTTPSLVILPMKDDTYRLAYMAVVAGSSTVSRIFVDAHTGELLEQHGEVQGQQAVGTGRGVLGDQKKLSTSNEGGVFIAFDRHRAPVIQTWDMHGNLIYYLLTRMSGFTPSYRASSPNNVWSDPAVVDAHVHVSWTYDYYFKRFKRSGLDGRDGDINIVVNPLTQQNWSVDTGYSNNAYWCTPCLQGKGLMLFGSGMPEGSAFYGSRYNAFGGALDIAAHELTHAVTSNTSRLVYANESGALNEAFSDMMGKSVEFFYHPPGSGVGQADYTIGKDISRAVASGVLNGDRSMANPGLYGDPDHYSRYIRTTQDNGGVHYNSGIPNQAFYLAIEGGTNRTSGLSVQGVGGNNREQIEQVFYRAFTTLLPSNASFSTARNATIQAARDLYGPGGAVERAVTQAWDAVGVFNVVRLPTYDGSLRYTGESFNAGYVVDMPATGRYQAVLNWTDPSIDLDLMIARPGCQSYNCMLTRAESATTRPETICLDVRAGERYWVFLQNFSARTAAYTLTQTINPTPSGPCTLAGAGVLAVPSSSDYPSERRKQLMPTPTSASALPVH